MCLYAASSILPSVAADRAAAALVGAGTTSPPRVRHALATAELASSLDPLADDGLKAAAQIAIAAGELSDARRDLLDAVHRDPSDAGAWQQLANLEAQTGDRHGLQVAATQALALDPRGDSSLKIAQGAIAAQTPPSASATATGTPLPSTGGQ
jgi:predicted Zn-dependent protease